VTAGPDIEALYRQHGHIVLRRARRLLGNEVDAFEVLQEVFLSLLENSAQLDRARSLVAFLYGATSHHCLNRLRNQHNRARLMEDHTDSVPEAAAPARADDLAAVAQVLARLPADQARAAFHHHHDGMTHEEIALVMGCSRRHVGDLLERAGAWIQAQEQGS
jgi:RNA polymerase sigma-70 factor (ECF subfamily)